MKIRGIVTITVLILAIIAVSTTTAAALSCDCGDICVNETGWWRDVCMLNASGTPIQAAVDNATAGETICVAAGSYAENVVITKRLTLAGEGADLTIVDGGAEDPCFEVDWTDGVNITGFTTTNAEYGAAIYLNHANHCNISGNNVSYNDNYGIRVYYSSYNTLTGNAVEQNGDHGIHIYYGYNNTVAENIVENNTNTYSSGVYLNHGDYNVISDNTASYNYYGIGLYTSNGNVVTGNTVRGNSMYGFRMYDADDNTITYNWVTENGDAGFHMTGGTSGSTGNNISCNNIIANSVYGIWLESLSDDNLIYNNFFNNTNNAYDDGNNQWNITKTSGTNIIGEYFLGGNYWSDYAGVDNTGDGLGDTMLPYRSSGYIQNGGDYHPLVSAAVIPCAGDIYVNESGWQRDGGAFNASGTPIQAAVDNATAGETICVAAGSYTENVDIATSHLTLKGEGADVVTVTNSTANSHIFKVTGDYVNINGFTVTGAATRSGITLLRVEHCAISNNTVSDNGCGIDVVYSANNTLLNNTASNNVAGIWLYDSGNNTLLNNTASNRWIGIGLESSCHYNTIANNTAPGNGKYGIYLNDSSNSNTIANNTASNNKRGIYMHSSCDNNIACNLMQNNTDCGICLESGSTGNNITWNNIVANGELQTDGSYHYQFKNSQSDGVDAINNFWGVGMNNDTIDASIYDDEEGQAEMKFYPFETEPAPCAPAPVSEELPAFTTVDAAIALRIAVGSRPLDMHWDVSGDGQVTSLDALMIAMDART